MEKPIVLLVGYNKPINGDAPSLVIAEQTPTQLVYKKVIYGPKATRLYEELIRKE